MAERILQISPDPRIGPHTCDGVAHPLWVFKDAGLELLPSFINHSRFGTRIFIAKCGTYVVNSCLNLNRSCPVPSLPLNLPCDLQTSRPSTFPYSAPESFRPGFLVRVRAEAYASQARNSFRFSASSRARREESAPTKEFRRNSFRIR